MILEGWRDGILSGSYSGVHYHCASASVAHWISRLAKKVWLTGPAFVSAAQMSAEEIAALSPAATDEEPRPAAWPEDAAQPNDEETEITVTRASLPPAPVAVALPEPPSPLEPEPEPETAEAAAARDEFIRELLYGPAEPQRRWRWRH